MADGRPLTSEELRRHIASLNQLKRMCRCPTDSRAEGGFSEPVDDDLERKLDELEEELQEDLSS
jgi:hypothetical protein